MASNSELDLVVLRDAINRILDYMIDELHANTIQLDKSLYWDMDPNYKYDMSKDPREFEVGNLHDDWDFVCRIPEEDEVPVILKLTEIAPLIQYIGETFNQFAPKKNKK